jgi:plastocyanin
MNRSPLLRVMLALLAVLPLSAGPAAAVEPGVDIAFPRVLISTVGSVLQFMPDKQTLEPGDYVRWVFNTTVLITHTTTSGSGCLANGIWNATLSSTTPVFTQGFPGPPGPFPYFCSPHCGLGMTGLVTVTTPIDLAADDSAGLLMLAWSGGGGSYQVFRSDNPMFAGPGTVVLQPSGGSTGTTLSDQTIPAAGKAIFFLVMNL